MSPTKKSKSVDADQKIIFVQFMRAGTQQLYGSCHAVPSMQKCVKAYKTL